MKQLFTVAITLTVFVLSMNGCGGGSSGTGTGGVETRTIEGSVNRTDGSDASGILITVVQTEASTITNELGAFSLETPITAGEVDLRLQGEDIDATVKVPDVSEVPSTVSVTITVPESGKVAAISNVEVLARIVGRCDTYFENLRVIRQSNTTPGGLTCVARVFVQGDGKTLGKVGVRIQARKCPKASEWFDVAEGVTMSGTNSGVAQVPFPYVDDADHCVYRIIAPDGIEEVPPVVYEIFTFTKQAFDARKTRK